MAAKTDAKDMLPEIIKRREQRFFVPIDKWIGQNDIVSKILSEENIKEGKYFNYDYIRSIFKKKGFLKGKLSIEGE